MWGAKLKPLLPASPLLSSLHFTPRKCFILGNPSFSAVEEGKQYGVIVIGAGHVAARHSQRWRRASNGPAFSAVEEGEQYDVIVIGAGHAGCEAALASARLGARTLLLTLSLDKIAWQVGGIEAWGGGRGMGGVRQLWRPPGFDSKAIPILHTLPPPPFTAILCQPCNRGIRTAKSQSVREANALVPPPRPLSPLFPPVSPSLPPLLQPCNPAVGGPAKSQLVHETDALGGEIGRMTDRCYVQKRVLNRSRGPAVWALRAHPHSSCTFPHPPHSSPPLPTPLLPLRCYMQKRVLNRLCWPIGCYVQKRVLNRSRGPAVWALRAQTDKREYSEEMRKVVEK
ncbi:unnamed protein product [Closterium sp. NIES-65]|nr:unnamed protein product [Closterium sp. NIES-65]